MSSCAQHLAAAIHEQDTHTLFALAGATFAPLLMAFEDQGGTIVGGRHESGTVGAADGYARRTGKTGFAMIVAEQGLANAMTALMTAAQAETPVVVIATRFPDSWIEPGQPFDVDRHEMTAPFLKYSRTVTSPERVGEYFRAACKAANEGVPGPALLVMPLDFLGREIDRFAFESPVSTALPPADAAHVEVMTAMLEKARRPIIVTDNRAAQSPCQAGLKALAERGIPVLGNGLGRGLVPEKAPHGYPWPYAQIAAPQADLVIAVGARMNMWFGYGRAPRFGENTRFIHIDSSAEAIGRNDNVDLAVVADPGATLALLADHCRAAGYSRDASWLEKALQPRNERASALLADYGDNLHSASIGAALNETLGDDRVLVCDGADSMNFTFATMRVHTARSYSDLLPFGAMGAGFPIAVGMAAAEAEKLRAGSGAASPVAFVTGDGSLGFFLAELDTLARSGLPLIVLVANDGKWGTEYHGQKQHYGRAINTELGHADYAAIARAFGCDAVTASTRGELVAAINDASARKGPSLIDVRVDPMSGKVRKEDPLLGMIIFEDIAKD